MIKTNRASLIIQKKIRGVAIRMKYRYITQAVNKIKAYMKMKWTREMLKEIKEATTVIQVYIFG